MTGEKRVRVKTSIFFTTYDEKEAAEILNYIRSNYKVIGEERSSVVKELYCVCVEGRASELKEYLKDKVLWHKVDVIEFK